MALLTEELKAKWVAALRSGKYDQGQAALKTAAKPHLDKNQNIVQGETFCCLGVLCDVVDPTAWTLSGETAHPLAEEGMSYLKNGLGLGGCTGKIQEKLVKMNDSGLHTFSAIADYIEKYVHVRKAKNVDSNF